MARKDFHHPFQPYEIQQDLMEVIHSCIEDSKVGVFESPTGTGKSLSLICASLTWLREHKRRDFEEALNAIELDGDDPEWMIEHAREERRKEIRQLRADLEARLEAVRKREESMRRRKADGEPPFKRRKQDQNGTNDECSAEEQFVLDDYDSDDEKRATGASGNIYSSETASMMQKLGMLRDQEKPSTEEGSEDELKIFFCSRTHSQLSQFVGELQRVKLPPGLPPENDVENTTEDLKHLTLGSRKNLCINPKVSKLGNQTAINERCVELQQSNTPADHKCPFLPNKESEDAVLDFRDHALAKIRDIEELAVVGTKLGICPYYASRPAISPAEMVTLPYPLLLQKSARDALGIDLKDHVVIIDEAHNLIDTVEGIHSSQITGMQLIKAREGLMIYLQKFRNRLKGSNRAYVTQLVRVLDSLLAYTAKAKDFHEIGGMVQPRELLASKGADQVNMTKLVRYINESKLARKVEGYLAHVRNDDVQRGHSEPTASAVDVPTLTQVSNFLMPLMNPSKEGKFFWSREGETITLKYMLLDPSEHFRDVVENARAVILAGGTMSPMEDYKQQLFPYVDDLRTHSCGHLIPPSSLLVRPISADENGPLDFSFKARGSPSTSLRIGRALASLAPKVTGGLVVFFPSYSFLEEVLTQWRTSNDSKNNFRTALNALKPLFTDSRSAPADETFKAYTAAVTSNPTRGAILLSVIGGKLSEGINFSDALGRCVVVVGLPFPNLQTPEWKAKLEYIEARAVARGEAAGRAGKAHAENVCMRAVNQAVGRVIRHKGDWASVLLMDARYAQERIWGKLPGWIKEGLPPEAGRGGGVGMQVGKVVEDVGRFFDGRES